MEVSNRVEKPEAIWGTKYFYLHVVCPGITFTLSKVMRNEVLQHRSSNTQKEKKQHEELDLELHCLNFFILKTMYYVYFRIVKQK